MSGSHIGFGRLSDFYDELIQSEQEKTEIQEHLNSCEECKTEFNRLRSTIKLVAQLCNEECNLKGFPIKTIRAARLRKKRVKIIRFLPALAASLLIFSIWMLQSDTSKNAGRGITGDKAVSKDNIKNQKGSGETAVNLIGNYRGKVLEVADQYVEGEITYDKFNRFLRELGHNGFYKIKYRVIDESDSMSSSINIAAKYQYIQNIEQVGDGDKIIIDEGVKKSDVKSRVIRFRIFK